MVILDVVVRVILIFILIYMTITIIKDVKNGNLKDFFGNGEEEEEKEKK